ncbi:MAG: efflux RND transporter periplasmic adaptor subunit [Gammaproteobacteria bacterium]|nr:efflux RND transporter periplasmic adaptor subunit [Gammaproteobacteria bacterium]
MKNTLLLLLLLNIMAFSLVSIGATEEHNDDGLIELTEAQLQAANIKTKIMIKESLSERILAFGELVNNDYKSYVLTSPVKARIIDRKAFLGQKVSKGDVLISLYSEDIASLQSQYSIASSEWNRIQRLGKSTVGAKRYNNAQVAFQAANSKLSNIGISLTDPKTIDTKPPLGTFYLSALADGVILEDKFTQGQIVEPGQVLMTMVDEDTLWVDAKITSNKLIPTNAKAKVIINKASVDGEIIQFGHAIDEVTRTRKVRLLIDNPNDHFHAGMFADIEFDIPKNEQGFLINQGSVFRTSDGDWAVFIEEKPYHFRQQEVELGINLGDVVEIKGINERTKVVTNGAFYLQSEAQKSGFDIHGH